LTSIWFPTRRVLTTFGSTRYTPLHQFVVWLVWTFDFCLHTFAFLLVSHVATVWFTFPTYLPYRCVCVCSFPRFTFALRSSCFLIWFNPVCTFCPTPTTPPGLVVPTLPVGCLVCGSHPLIAFYVAGVPRTFGYAAFAVVPHPNSPVWFTRVRYITIWFVCVGWMVAVYAHTRAVRSSLQPHNAPFPVCGFGCWFDAFAFAFYRTDHYDSVLRY